MKRHFAIQTLALASLMHLGTATATVITFDSGHFPIDSRESPHITAPYSESGFTVTPDSANWLGLGAYTPSGRPSFIYFYREYEEAFADSVKISHGGHEFSFQSVQLYSSIAPVPYVFTGWQGSNVVFTATGTMPHSDGDFVTVGNPYSSALIDKLEIRLTNLGVSNPVGLSLISVTSSVPEPGALALLGAGVVATIVRQRKQPLASSHA